MKTLFGSLLEIANRAPVPYVSDRLATFSLPVFGKQGPGRFIGMMSANPTLFAIVDKCASGAAAVDWHLYRKRPPGAGPDAEREEVTVHAALDLWSRPNGFYTQSEFIESVQQHHELTGEMWWVIARDPRSTIPLELWPVRPDRMEPVADARRYLVGYVYHGPDGEDVPLELDEVIFVRRPNPDDPYRGISAVAAALVHIEGASFAAQWNRNFFKNSAEPGGIVKVERKLSQPEFRMLRQRWGEQHQGVAAAHHVAILEGGMEWVERKYTQRDMEFVKLREATREDIREAFGFPKPLLGAVDDVNRANADAAEYVFSKWVLVPRLDRIKQALNADLLPLFGPAGAELEFDYDSPVTEDAEAENAERDSKVAAFVALVGMGVDAAEAAEWLGLPEFNVTPPAVPAVAPPGAEPAEEEAAPLPPGRRGQPASALPRGNPRASAEDREDWEDRLDALLERWETEVTPDQIDALVTSIQAIVDQGAPGDLAQLAVPTDVAEGLLGDVMLDQAEAAGRRMAELAAEQGVSIAPVSPWPQATSNLLGKARSKQPAYDEFLAADLRAAARVQTKFLGQGLSAFAAQEALHQWQPGSASVDVADAVRERLESLTAQSLRNDLGSSVWAAENEGRFSTLEKAAAENDLAVSYVADEVRDTNTCAECKDIDGTVYTDLATAQADYPFGGYVRCAGRSRCRGTITPSWS